MYFWLKFLHIVAIAVWFTGLFFLPRLFIARHRAEGDARRDYFNPVTNMLFFRLATPAAVIAITLGMVLIAYGPSGAWLPMKLALVSLAVLLHLYLGLLLYELGHGRDRHGPVFYHVIGWLPLLLLLAIAALTSAKPQTVGDLPPPPTAVSVPRQHAERLLVLVKGAKDRKRMRCGSGGFSDVLCG